VVQPITTETEARNAAAWIKRFTERREHVRLEEACLTGMIDGLTERLLEYRKIDNAESE
jgi:hypothetical protein